MRSKVVRNIDNFRPDSHVYTDDCKDLFLDVEGAQYLYLTLSQCHYQLHKSNEVFEKQILPKDKPFQHLVNGLLMNDLQAMTDKLEKVFPELRDIVEDID